MNSPFSAGRYRENVVSCTLTLILLLACAPTSAIQIPAEATYAANQSVDDDRWYVIEQRSQFLRAESALSKREMQRFRELRDGLRDYPLYPYLEFADLSRRLGSAGSDEIQSFLERHADTPLAWRLRRTWLKRLARRGQWEKYLTVYEQTGDTTMQCQWLRALINADRADEALPHVDPATGMRPGVQGMARSRLPRPRAGMAAHRACGARGPPVAGLLSHSVSRSR
jgi:hypothetical protein